VFGNMTGQHLTLPAFGAYIPYPVGIGKMPALRKSLPLLLALALLGQAAGLRAEARPSGVGGRVVGDSNPLSAAHIYAYQLSDLSLRKVLTDGQGSFLFQDLPAGLYKIIAHKAGFMPAVIMLTRTTAQAYQFLEVQLAQRQAGLAADGDDFWAIRARVPADVLHQIEAAEADANTIRIAGLGSFGTRQRLTLPASGFKTQWQAVTGVDEIAAPGGGQMSGGDVGVQGQLGTTAVDLHGHFVQLSPEGTYQPAGGSPAGSSTGQASSLAIDLAHGPNSRMSFQSYNNRIMTRSDSGHDSPVDLEHYQVNWSQNVGESGHSEVAARYTAENNFNRQAAIDPLNIPDASRSWNIEAAYTEAFSDSNSLQAGLRYRDRQFGLGDADRLPTPGPVNSKTNDWQDQSSIDMFSRGGLRIEPTVLVEYGLYSTLSDGSLTLTPKGGLVFQVSPAWQLETSAARRIYQAQPPTPDFLPTLFEQRDLCEQGSESCYQMNLTRKVGTDDSLTFGAVQRKVGDTLRLYFSDDFFDRDESVYLVRGDKLPELRVGFQHKISPNIVTKLDSSLASGGGGLYVGSDGLAYKNQVRYLVTSLDTKFLGSSTGIFVAFHHLQQQLDPSASLGGPTTQMDFERLQLMVNQNLSFLLNLASDWAVQLNMELSRGTDPTTGLASDAIRKRILGGIAVKF
jgi:hypothetical protein